MTGIKDQTTNEIFSRISALNVESKNRGTFYFDYFFDLTSLEARAEILEIFFVGIVVQKTMTPKGHLEIN